MIKLIGCGAFSYPKTFDRDNQDSFLTPRSIGNGFLLAVADGVGAYFGADKASKIAIDVLAKTQVLDGKIDVENTFKAIRSEIAKLSVTNESFKDAATTLTFCYASEKGFQIGHVGDCRIYVRKNDKLIQLTKDHTQHQKLLDEGIYRASELKKLSGKSTLFTALSKNIELHSQEIYIPYHDITSEKHIDLFIMSDGAHHFWEKRPRFLLNTLSDPSSFASSLHRRIKRFQPIDDYTLVAAKFRFCSDRADYTDFQAAPK
ncbi:MULTISPECIES: PP2C family serine/threonine-protein phosphatase [unclassified Pseudomonas]|uniref:PP2C family protein-serine/threonine phosphatase n=1 Tax=unclassified Pseudomonas TaxID=196821 RepID=UPI001C60E1A2|nr:MULTISPECIES: PP2C family serine/threonine-protein phosphatase [unclassified Pseudomonas]MBW5414807.1 serine/threonine-protein phosphatase [Pseudomonas sp. MAG002Y]